jgi:hypothetical protein
LSLPLTSAAITLCAAGIFGEGWWNAVLDNKRWNNELWTYKIQMGGEGKGAFHLFMVEEMIAGMPAKDYCVFG